MGQVTDLSRDFFKSKRDEFRKKLPEASVAVLFSAPIRNRANDVNYVYHQDPSFYYLSGWKEPNAVLLIYKEAQKDDQGIFYNKIFIRSSDPVDEMWNGKYTTPQEALSMGFDRVDTRVNFSSKTPVFSDFDKVLLFEFKNDERDNPADPYDLYDLKKSFKEKINFPEIYDRKKYVLYQKIKNIEESSADSLRSELQGLVTRDPSLLEDQILKDFLDSSHLDVLNEIRQKTAFAIKDYNFDLEKLPQIMKGLREIKTEEEIELIRKAAFFSAVGQVEVMKAIHPEMSEREIQGIHEFVYRKYGAADQGYPSIVGAGGNACVLHYIENNKFELNNELVLMDLGAELSGYTADVTRTIPSSGTYTPDQRLLYEIVYASQEKGIQAAVIGNSFVDIYKASFDAIALGLIELGIINSTTEVKKYFPHGVSHHIGLDVHDPGNYGLLAADMIITVEPGIYIPKGSPCDPRWWNIGIRIEDDILITKKGPKNLSDFAPRKWDEIEKIIQQKSHLDDFNLPSAESLSK